MNNSSLYSYGIILVIVLLMFWLRSRRSAKPRPIRRNGFGMLIPVVVLLIVFGFSLASLTHIPDHPFHLPAVWEILCACAIGTILGSVMLYYTEYEKRADGRVYSKPNKNFQYVLLTIIVIRIGLTQYLKTLDYVEFTFLAMVMAYVYICIWRIGSFVKFRRVRAQ
ncbi:CcdC protein domain-containing protein [Cohnella thermotolerans]|uniref:CcdC protein domain-containing protein n=1 Tax=Cohnella thermotolerans TaxID=329858 RepID=UPI00040BBAA4|nr:CcdC protein domain-containing protein [Cohnella thermotolerans]